MKLLHRFWEYSGTIRIYILNLLSIYYFNLLISWHMLWKFPSCFVLRFLWKRIFIFKMGQQSILESFFMLYKGFVEKQFTPFMPAVRTGCLDRSFSHIADPLSNSFPTLMTVIKPLSAMCYCKCSYSHTYYLFSLIYFTAGPLP